MQIFQVNIHQKGHFLLFLTLLWTYLTVKHKPFNDLNLNSIDNFSNVCSTVILFCGCLYLFEVNLFVKPMLYLVIVIINVMFVTIFAKACIIIAFSMVKNKRINIAISKISAIFGIFQKSISKTKFNIRIFKYFKDLFANYKREQIKKRCKPKFSKRLDNLSI